MVVCDPQVASEELGAPHFVETSFEDDFELTILALHIPSVEILPLGDAARRPLRRSARVVVISPLSSHKGLAGSKIHLFLIPLAK
jgi:hypothetical protein